MAIPLMKQATDDRPQPAPLRYGAVWGAGGMSLAESRHAVRTLLAQAGYDPATTVSQDAQIVVSELVTNAQRHAPGGGGLLLEVTSDLALLRVTVRDTSPRPPTFPEPDRRRVGGHGLHLVTRICDRLHTVALADGKQVVAELALRHDRGRGGGG
ncbi:hypothetical protein DN402_33235 [Streptomyces sp. SW4]|nr:hypothetical protein DN402_33235 [Streptomyces sp. SW4]